MNFGATARLKATQFSRFCKDAVPFTLPGGGIAAPSFRPVDVDIIFKCVVTQEVIADEQRKAAQAAMETKLKVVHAGLLPAGYGPLLHSDG